MKIVKDMAQWRTVRGTLEEPIGFVPTMGALHDGHASLLKTSIRQNHSTVLSIYLNPTQFNDPKDLDHYPSTLDTDLALAEKLGVDFVLLPRYEDLYADGYRYQVVENQFGNELCGANRPGHFTGVLTVVMKLLNLVRPARAYFGKKDHQQYLLVRDMVDTFFMDTQIIGCETVRECDGLAMSSRNQLLSPEARRVAGHFNRVLRLPDCDEKIRAELLELGVTVDYLETRANRRYGAIVVDSNGSTVRLIDNMEVMQ